MSKFHLPLLSLLLVMAAPAYCQKAEASAVTMTILVDARAPWSRHIPVRLILHPDAGKLALTFPGWLPGSHAMDAPFENFARLRIMANGAPLAWRRDAYNVRLIHLDVPPGTGTVEADYDYAPARNVSSELYFGVSAGRDLAVLNPAAFALAPVGNPKTLTAALSIRLPTGWSAATALPLSAAKNGEADTCAYKPVSLYALIDSPILAGSHHKTVVLPVPASDVPHTLELFGDTAAIVETKAPVVVPLLTRLVAESGRMFGTRHYRSFRYLLALTSEIGRNGLEHHESAIYALQPDTLDDKAKALLSNSWNANLIPHEFVHSWNGKFRRPYGEDARSNIAPQSSDLIWVYEGLTEYLGEVLMVRAGFRTAEAWRNDLMTRPAGLRAGSGRDWQSLADASITASHTYITGPGTGLRGPGDIYYEGMLIWLEADAIIRRESGGTRSLDDFCRVFFGGRNRGAEVKRYTERDVVRALQRAQTHDWDSFVQSRFYAPPAGLPTAGLEAAGWKLAFTDKPDKAAMVFPGDYRDSLGLMLAPTGRIAVVLENSIADRAGLEDGMVVMLVNGAKFTPAAFQEALRATRESHVLQVQVSDGGQVKTLRIEGLQGEQFPVLARISKVPDLLQAITAPLAPSNMQNAVAPH